MEQSSAEPKWRSDPRKKPGEMLKWIEEAKKISRWRPNGIKGNVTVPTFPGEKKKKRQGGIQ